MEKRCIRLVDVTEIFIAGFVAWILKEILNYAKRIVWNRFQSRDRLKFRCALGTIGLIGTDRILRALRWHRKGSTDPLLRIMSPLALEGVYLLLTRPMPTYVCKILSDTPIGCCYTFDVRI
jgi:hypothetical protein